MSDHSHQLSALLGSRICHDLISPLGAIGNGLELLAMAGNGEMTPEMALISESVENANARLKFFRVAFGAVSGNANGGADPGAPIAPGEVGAILADYAKAGRVSIDWQVVEAAPRALVRAAFLLIQCVETALPFGGEIRVSVDQGSGRWRIEGRAEKMKVNAALWEHLSRPAAAHALTPGEVHFGLVHPALTAIDRTLRLEIGDGIGIRAEF